MITASRTPKYIEQSREFINLVGAPKMAKVADLKYQVLNGWKNRGIPKGWLILFRYLYPKEFKQIFNESKRKFDYDAIARGKYDD